MTRHLLTSTTFDFDAFRRRKADGLGPEHVAERLADELGAEICQPGDVEPTLIDRLAGRLFAAPETWAVARSLSARLDEGDLVYATGHDVGLALAAWNVVRRNGALAAVYYVAPDRPRERLLTGLLTRLGARMLAVSGTDVKVGFLERRFGDRLFDVVLADEQTDVEFFSPATETAPGAQDGPLVASAGLEQRDYRTLAAALEGTGAEAKVCAVSPNFSDRTPVTMPDPVPDTMSFGHLEFDELRDLYQQADVTVIPLLDNDYSAGLTVLMEASACGAPVIMTRTPGLAERFVDDDLVVGVPPGDVEALRSAITDVLADPDAARRRAERARDRILERHTSARYVRDLIDALERFEKEFTP